MDIEILQAEVDAAVAMGSHHTLECAKALSASGLHAALAYCRQHGIEPPRCSLTAKSANADLLRIKAASMLSETKWWERRLEQHAARSFEDRQISEGRVTNYVSDATMEYMRRKNIR